MARKSKNGSEFLSAFGILCEIVMAIVNAVRSMGGGDEDLHRVITEPGLAKRIAELIMASAKPVAKAGETVAKEVATVFKVVVEYIQPSYADLKIAFDWVNSDYSLAKFEPIERCKGVLRNTCEIAFQYVQMGRDASTEEVLAERWIGWGSAPRSMRSCWPSPSSSSTSSGSTRSSPSAPSGRTRAATATWPASAGAAPGAA